MASHDNGNVPEPFQYARAHSYPPPSRWSSDPGERNRTPLLVALIGAAVVLSLVTALVVGLLGRGDPGDAQVAQGAGATAPNDSAPGETALDGEARLEQELARRRAEQQAAAPQAPEPTVGQVPPVQPVPAPPAPPVQEPGVAPPPPPRADIAPPPPSPSAAAVPARQSVARRTPVRRTTPPARDRARAMARAKAVAPARKRPVRSERPLAHLLLEPADLRGVNPGRWGVLRERLWAKAGSRPSILSCTESVDVPPHLARVFLAPLAPGVWDHRGHAVVQRLRQYPAGKGDDAVRAIRAMRNSCPVRQRYGYSEHWRVVRDEHTRRGDVIWYRRELRSPDPAGNDLGSDWMVLRNGDRVTMVELIKRRPGMPDAAAESLLRSLRAETCYGGACAGG